MDIDYSKYWFRLKVLYVEEGKELSTISYYFDISQKMIKVYESCKVKDDYFTLITFNDESTVISDKPIKRFKQEVLPKYNELVNEYLNLED